MIPLRLYGLQGCNFCLQAEQFLQAAKVPYQYVSAEKDPIIMQGAERVTGNSPPQFPILVSLITRDVIRGFDATKYQKVISVFNNSIFNVAR